MWRNLLIFAFALFPMASSAHWVLEYREYQFVSKGLAIVTKLSVSGNPFVTIKIEGVRV